MIPTTGTVDGFDVPFRLTGAAASCSAASLDLVDPAAELEPVCKSSVDGACAPRRDHGATGLI